MSVVGIDYGNLDCVIAQAKRGGIDILLNENSNRKNPNMVCIQGKQRLIGEAAVSVARMHYKNTATDIKRLIGCQYSHPDTQAEISRLPFRCVELENGEVGIVLRYDDGDVTFRCEQLVAMLLGKLQHIVAASNDGIGNSDVVISVPSYFTDIQRKAVLSAANVAGLKVLRIMNEHCAVALAYGIYKSARNLFHESEAQYVMFIDMGHSAYTVSIVSFVQGKLQVRAVAYDRHLGGRDFDAAIAGHVNKLFQEKTKQNAMEHPKARMKLLAACEKAKKNLSPHGVTQTNVNVECLVDEYDYSGILTLETFEELIEGLLTRLEKPVQDALKEAGIEKSALSHIEIIGGGTRVASVKRKLADILGLDKNKNNMGLGTTLNADESVARGCALQCAILSPMFKVKEFHIQDKVNFPVRLSWEPCSDPVPMETGEDEEDETSSTGASSMVIFDRTHEFPKTRRITFRRSEAFEVDAAYDDAAKPYLPENCPMQLGKYVISGLPEPKADDKELPRIRVNVRQDLNGIFTIASSQLMQEIIEEPTPVPAPTEGETTEAKEEKTEEAKDNKSEEAPAPKKKRYRRVELKVESKPVYQGELSGQSLLDAREHELRMAQQDRIIEETANKRNELESYIYDMRNQICDRLKPFISDGDRSSFENLLQAQEDWLYSDEGFDSTKSIYTAKLKELQDIGAPIEFRFTESTSRPAAQKELLALTEEYKKLANSSDDAYSHWTDEDRDQLRKQSSEAETWLYDQLAIQNDLAATQAPVLKSSDIRSRGVTLRDACKSILMKPKPKPEPVPEEPKQEDAPKENTEEKKEMDLD